MSNTSPSNLPSIEQILAEPVFWEKDSATRDQIINSWETQKLQEADGLGLMDGGLNQESVEGATSLAKAKYQNVNDTLNLLSDLNQTTGELYQLGTRSPMSQMARAGRANHLKSELDQIANRFDSTDQMREALQFTRVAARANKMDTLDFWGEANRTFYQVVPGMVRQNKRGRFDDWYTKLTATSDADDRGFGGTGKFDNVGDNEWMWRGPGDPVEYAKTADPFEFAWNLYPNTGEDVFAGEFLRTKDDDTPWWKRNKGRPLTPDEKEKLRPHVDRVQNTMRWRNDLADILRHDLDPNEDLTAGYEERTESRTLNPATWFNLHLGKTVEMTAETLPYMGTFMVPIAGPAFNYGNFYGEQVDRLDEFGLEHGIEIPHADKERIASSVAVTQTAVESLFGFFSIFGKGRGPVNRSVGSSLERLTNRWAGKVASEYIGRIGGGIAGRGFGEMGEEVIQDTAPWLFENAYQTFVEDLGIPVAWTWDSYKSEMGQFWKQAPEMGIMMLALGAMGVGGDIQTAGADLELGQEWSGKMDSVNEFVEGEYQGLEITDPVPMLSNRDYLLATGFKEPVVDKIIQLKEQGRLMAAGEEVRNNFDSRKPESEVAKDAQERLLKARDEVANQLQAAEQNIMDDVFGGVATRQESLNAKIESGEVSTLDDLVSELKAGDQTSTVLENGTRVTVEAGKLPEVAQEDGTSTTVDGGTRIKKSEITATQKSMQALTKLSRGKLKVEDLQAHMTNVEAWSSTKLRERRFEKERQVRESRLRQGNEAVVPGDKIEVTLQDGKRQTITTQEQFDALPKDQISELKLVESGTKRRDIETRFNLVFESLASHALRKGGSWQDELRDHGYKEDEITWQNAIDSLIGGYNTTDSGRSTFDHTVALIDVFMHTDPRRTIFTWFHEVVERSIKEDIQDGVLPFEIHEMRKHLDEITKDQITGEDRARLDRSSDIEALAIYSEHTMAGQINANSKPVAEESLWKKFVSWVQAKWAQIQKIFAAAVVITDAIKEEEEAGGGMAVDWRNYIFDALGFKVPKKFEYEATGTRTEYVDWTGGYSLQRDNPYLYSRLGVGQAPSQSGLDERGRLILPDGTQIPSGKEMTTATMVNSVIPLLTSRLADPRSRLLFFNEILRGVSDEVLEETAFLDMGYVSPYTDIDTKRGDLKYAVMLRIAGLQPTVIKATLEAEVERAAETIGVVSASQIVAWLNSERGESEFNEFWAQWTADKSPNTGRQYLASESPEYTQNRDEYGDRGASRAREEARRKWRKFKAEFIDPYKSGAMTNFEALREGFRQHRQAMVLPAEHVKLAEEQGIRFRPWGAPVIPLTLPQNDPLIQSNTPGLQRQTIEIDEELSEIYGVPVGQMPRAEFRQMVAATIYDNLPDLESGQQPEVHFYDGGTYMLPVLSENEGERMETIQLLTILNFIPEFKDVVNAGDGRAYALFVSEAREIRDLLIEQAIEKRNKKFFVQVDLLNKEHVNQARKMLIDSGHVVSVSLTVAPWKLHMVGNRLMLQQGIFTDLTREIIRTHQLYEAAAGFDGGYAELLYVDTELGTHEGFRDYFHQLTQIPAFPGIFVEVWGSTPEVRDWAAHYGFLSPQIQESVTAGTLGGSFQEEGRLQQGTSTDSDRGGDTGLDLARSLIGQAQALIEQERQRDPEAEPVAELERQIAEVESLIEIYQQQGRHASLQEAEIRLWSVKTELETVQYQVGDDPPFNRIQEILDAVAQTKELIEVYQQQKDIITLQEAESKLWSVRTQIDTLEATLGDSPPFNSIIRELVQIHKLLDMMATVATPQSLSQAFAQAILRGEQDRAVRMLARLLRDAEEEGIAVEDQAALEAYILQRMQGEPLRGYSLQPQNADPEYRHWLRETRRQIHDGLKAPQVGVQDFDTIMNAMDEVQVPEEYRALLADYLTHGGPRSSYAMKGGYSLFGGFFKKRTPQSPSDDVVSNNEEEVEDQAEKLVSLDEKLRPYFTTDETTRQKETASPEEILAYHDESGDGGPSGSRRSQHGTESLRQWANETGRILSHTGLGGFLGQLDRTAAGTEHQVFFIGDTGHVIKLVKHTSIWQKDIFEYLRNHQRANALLGDDVQISVVGLMDDGVNPPTLVVSQPYIPFARYASQREMRDHFEPMGFHEVGVGVFYNPGTGMVISDAASQNVLATGESAADLKIYPIDVHVHPVSPRNEEMYDNMVNAKLRGGSYSLIPRNDRLVDNTNLFGEGMWGRGEQVGGGGMNGQGRRVKPSGRERDMFEFGDVVRVESSDDSFQWAQIVPDREDPTAWVLTPMLFHDQVNEHFDAVQRAQHYENRAKMIWDLLQQEDQFVSPERGSEEFVVLSMITDRPVQIDGRYYSIVSSANTSQTNARSGNIVFGFRVHEALPGVDFELEEFSGFNISSQELKSRRDSGYSIITLREANQGRMLYGLPPLRVNPKTGEVFPIQRVQPAPIEGGTARAAEEILLDLSEVMRVDIGYKGVGEGAIGAYWKGEARMRLKYESDMSTAFHEMGHALDERYGFVASWNQPNVEMGAGRFDGELMDSEYGSSVYGFSSFGTPSKNHQERRAEAVAEWIRAWIINPAAAQKAAPEFYAHFVATVPIAVREALQEFGVQVRETIGSSAVDRMTVRVKWRPGDAMKDYSENVRRIRHGDFGFGPWSRFLANSEESPSRLARWLRGGLGFIPWGNFLRGFSDALRPVEEAWEFIKLEHERMESGRDFGPSKDAMLLARLFAGRNGMVEDIWKNGMVDKEGNPAEGVEGGLTWLLEPFDKENLDREMKDAMVLAIAQRVLEKSRQLGRDVGLTGADMGFDESDVAIATRALKELGVLDNEGNEIPTHRQSTITQRLMEGVRRYRAWSNANLRFMVETGILSEKKYREIMDANAYYVAMNRVIEDRPGHETIDFLNRHMKTGGSIGSVASDIKRFKGSSKRSENPYVLLMRNTAQIVREGLANEVKLAFVEGIRQAGGRLPTVGVKVAEDAEGNLLVVMNNGKREHWLLQADVYAAFKGWSNLEKWGGPFGKVLRFIPNLLRFGITMVPAFAATNATRDIQHRLTVTRHGNGPAWNQFLPQNLKRNMDPTMLRRFGGDQAGFYARERADYYRALDAAVYRAQGESYNFWANPWKGMGEIIKASWRGYESILLTGERVNRVAEFNVAKDYAMNELGYSDFEANLYAAGEARDLMDFAVAGTVMKVVNDFIPFSNAAVQGLKRNLRAATENPVAFLVRFHLYAAIPSILFRALAEVYGYDDELEQQPEYLSDMFWSIKIGPDAWIRIPRNFEIGVSAAVYDRLWVYQAARLDGLSDEQAREKAWGGYSGSFLRVLMPFDESVFLPGFKPIVETLANKDFFRNRAIVPPWEEGVNLDALNQNGERIRDPQHASRLGKAWQWTFEAFGLGDTAIGRRIGDARSGDHIFRGTLGTMGATAMQASNWGRDDTNNKLGPRNTGFFTNTPAYASKSVQEVYKVAGQKGISMQKKEFRRFKSAQDAYFNATTPEERQKAAEEWWAASELTLVWLKQEVARREKLAAGS